MFSAERYAKDMKLDNNAAIIYYPYEKPITVMWKVIEVWKNYFVDLFFSSLFLK